MYKKPNGGLGFSFNRLITNAVPNFANNNAADDSTLSLKQQDDLFAHQMRLEDPKVLDNLSLLACGVVEHKQHSSSILAKLHKIGIVSKLDGSIHTDLITKNLPNQLAEISIHKQRRLVSLLFFWEEELTRWRLLDEEEGEIRKALEKNGERGQEEEALKVALGTVWVKRSTPPSRRGEDGRTSVGGGNGGGVGGLAERRGSAFRGEDVEEEPPDYHDKARTVSISGGKYHTPEGESSSRAGEGERA